MKLFSVLAFIVALCAGTSASAQYVNTEIIKYNNNFITKAVEHDTSLSEDPSTGEITAVLTYRKGIKYLNNKLIYAEQEASAPSVACDENDLLCYLGNLLSEEIEELKSNSLNSFSAQIIIDDKGKFAYFEPEIKVFECKGKAKENVCEILDCIERKLETIRCIPALVEGENVPYWINFTSESEVVSNP